MKKYLPLLSLLGFLSPGISSLVYAKEEICMDVKSTRKADYPVNELILNRWSARAMSGEQISDRELYTLFEAARWAPSSYNGQPWRFIYAKRDTQHWDTFFNLLVPFNQAWCKGASALVMIVSKKNFDWNNKLSVSHSFDTGAAWQNIALQGSDMGLVVHGMAGFDYTKAQQELGISDEYAIEAMFAVGRPADATVLPEAMRENEKPSGRRSIKEFVFEGTLGSR